MRPDIAFAVQQISQNLENPHASHLNAANKKLQYLKGKPAQGLFYSSNAGTDIKAYTDAD